MIQYASPPHQNYLSVGEDFLFDAVHQTLKQAVLQPLYLIFSPF